MSYAATIPVDFDCPRSEVYEALCDLGSYPKWNTDMTSISYTGRMHVGLQYTTSTNVLGHVNKATIEVVEMVPNEVIVLASHTGLITFRAVFQLKEITPDSCSVICNLRFKFSTLVFNLARPVVEAAAESRIHGDLETLRSLLREAA
jgi:hypothetical protein